MFEKENTQKGREACLFQTRNNVAVSMFLMFFFFHQGELREPDGQDVNEVIHHRPSSSQVSI